MSTNIIHQEKNYDDHLLHPQFESMEQQNETYIVGMWAFLATEIMFFGALFLAYTLYRWKYQPGFYDASKIMNVTFGTLNTYILISSSVSMALAVHFAQVKKRKAQLISMSVTILFAFGFLVFKGLEYYQKIIENHVPGPTFHWTMSSVPENIAQLFISLYFAMTGLHAIHVIVGILIIGTLCILTWRKSRHVESYIPVEMAGLYWHFVDLVWCILYPLFYLIPE